MLKSPIADVLIDLDIITRDLRNLNISLTRVSCNLIRIIKDFEIKERNEAE